MTVKLLTEHHLDFLSLKGGCRGSSEFTHVKIPHCWNVAHYKPDLYSTTKETHQSLFRAITVK